jgi:IstB-like ATP binding protein
VGGQPRHANRRNALDAAPRRLSFIPLLVALSARSNYADVGIDRRGGLHTRFPPEAANPIFSLVSARCERASMIVTSNKPFSAWGEISLTLSAIGPRRHDDRSPGPSRQILPLKGDSTACATRSSAPERAPSRPKIA